MDETEGKSTAEILVEEVQKRVVYEVLLMIYDSKNLTLDGLKERLRARLKQNEMKG